MLRLPNIFRLLVWSALAALAAVLGLACGSANAGEVLVQFYSEHCEPCRQMAPVVADLQAAGYSVRRVNVDVDRLTAEQFGVTGLPCFVLLVNGRERARITGATDRGRLQRLFHASLGQGGLPRNAKPPVPGVPTPAWRYVAPVEHRTAVVRVACQDADGGFSGGSGVFVCYRRLRAVLTARHVVQNARHMRVWFSNGHVSPARILAADATWDVSVLGLQSPPDRIAPAELEYGPDAMQRAGNRLESCGYGADGRLACNCGRFLRYAQPAGAAAADWMEWSGHAREGDSGGPVFNRQGRVVGILWGTDGTKVVGVQAGRLHLVLQTAAQTRLATTTLSESGAEVVPCPCGPGQACALPPRTEPPKKRLLPYRADEDQRLAATDARLDKISSLLLAIQQANLAKQAEPAPPAGSSQPLEAARQEQASPLLAGLCILGSVLVGTIIYFAARKQ